MIAKIWYIAKLKKEIQDGMQYAATYYLSNGKINRNISMFIKVITEWIQKALVILFASSSGN